jgi:hypothetical protein
MSYLATPTRTFPANTAIGKHRRVILSSGFLALAGASDRELGTVEYPILTGEESGTVRLRTAEGTTQMVAGGSITAGANVFAAANGKVASTGTVLLGTALTAASGDNSVIEVLRTIPAE